MGRSTPSCFKIISCGGGSNEAIDRDEIDASFENKSPDKRGWSFRKRSGRHRVLSNTVVTEKLSSSENKLISEPISISSELQINSNVSEKTSENIWTEELPYSVTKNAAVSTMDDKSACEKDDIKCELDAEKCEPIPGGSESAILVIQSAVRRFLAERRLVKHKNVVKLQAAVRGHLVRNHAVGTLRCVQAIVKMQALVRARRQKGVQDAGINSKPTYISVEKLLSNRLARQLLESTPKRKQINIKCDPSKSDSAWNWLERWMSVSSPDILESHAPEHDPDILESHAPEHDPENVVNNSENEVETVVTSEDGELMVPFEEKENLIHIEENSNVKAHEEKSIAESFEKPDSLLNETMDLNTEPQIEVNSIPENPVSETKPKPILENPISETKLIPENPISETKPFPENPISETKPIPENPISETKLIPENPISETKLFPENPISETKLIPENPVSETKPIPENPISETKSFPENPILETKPITEYPISESKPIPENPISETKPIPENPVSETKPKPIPDNPVSEIEPKRTAKRAATDQPDSEGRKTVFGSRKASNPAFIAAQSRFEELTSMSMTKPLKPANSSNQDVSGSGCGYSDPLKSTNASNQDDVAGSSSPADIASSAPEKPTLVPDVEPDEPVVSHGSIAVRNSGSECGTELSVTSTLDSPDQFEVENKKPEEPKVLNEAVSDINMKVDNNINSDIDIVMPEKQADQKLNDSDIKLEPEQESELAPQISASGSPRSHITIPESQGTPSSQVSTNTKKSKTDKRSTSQKRKSWSSSKKPSVDSGPRSSLEQLPKDPKPGKRRNSFGSPKPDHVDHELSVPSYMQATESARAKAVANSSPALSPDVHDKESYLKKRQSLPGAVNGRQGSPRIQRSMSQALQTTKGNGSQDRKWQR